MIHDLAAAVLLTALAVFSFAMGAEFGDPVRRGLDRAGAMVRRSPALLVRSRGAHTGPMLAVPDVPAREVEESAARRMPDRVENGQAAGGAPGADGTRLRAEPPRDVPPHPRFGPLLNDTPSEGIPFMGVPGAAFRVGGELPSVKYDRPVVPVRTGGHPPWTGSFSAVQDPDAEDDDEMEAQIARVRFVRSQLPANGADVTREDMQRALDALRTHPYPTREERALVVDEAQRLGQVMIP